MKAMIVSDFAVLRSAILQLLGICAIIALFMGYAMGTLVGGAAAIAAMPPFMLLFSLAATDEQNGWERFRLPLPLPRRQVVFGRYASLALVAIGTIVFALALSFLLLGVISCMPAGTLPEGLTPAENPPAALVGSVVGAVGVITLGMAVTLPLVFRFGMTRATRFVPVVVVIAIACGIGFFDAGIQPTGVLADLCSGSTPAATTSSSPPPWWPSSPSSTWPARLSPPSSTRSASSSPQTSWKPCEGLALV